MTNLSCATAVRAMPSLPGCNSVSSMAGLKEATGSLEDRMRRQTERAIDAADFTLIDARAGVTPADKFFADQIRALARMVLAGQCEVVGSGGSCRGVGTRVRRALQFRPMVRGLSIFTIQYRRPVGIDVLLNG